MPEPQQRQYASTDPNFGQAERTYASTDPNFAPAATVPEKSTGEKILGTIKALGSVAVDPLGIVDKDVKSTLGDMSVGAAKRTGRNAVDLTALVQPGMRGVSSQVPGLQSQNTAETLGGVAADVAMSALPAGMAARGTKAVPGWQGLKSGAVRQWQRAAQRPIGESPAVAEEVLKSGLGRLTRANRDKWLASHPNMSPDAIKSMDASIANAERVPGSVTGLLLSPGARAAASQAVYSSAPALNATAGGGGGLLMQALARLLGGGQ